MGAVDPASLDDYRAQGGYAALRHAFRLGPAGVIREVLDSGLVGRAARPSPPDASGRPPPASPTTPTTWSATPTRASRAPSRTA
nr:hypothetical protein GCM10020093_106830 [Planobispora longispora]